MVNISSMIGVGRSGLDSPPAPLPRGPGEPAWDVARFFPPQGDWTEDEYHSLANSVNCFVEFDNGFIEVLPMPTIEHQLIARLFFDLLRGFVESRELGVVLFGPLQTWLDDKRYKQPDILYVTKERHAKSEKYYQGVDLAMEVVSPDDRSHHRDWIEKRELYAKAGIPEYWVVDPQEQRVMVLTLDGDKYAEHANLVGEGAATSKLLDGFSVDAAELFAAGKKR